MGCWIPIPKPYKDPTSSDNYRPVALAPTLSKALERSILLAYPQYFTTSDLQFGFKKGLSTSLCTGLIKNVVSRLGMCITVLLSMVVSSMPVRLFDRVNHHTLFTKLSKGNLPPVLN